MSITDARKNITELFIRTAQSLYKKKSKISLEDLITDINSDDIQETLKNILASCKEDDFIDEEEFKQTGSAFGYFCDDKRVEVMMKFIDDDNFSVSNELLRMWREDFPTDRDREKYVQKALEYKNSRDVSEYQQGIDYESESEEISEDGMRRDEWYYGEIPTDCTYEKLVEIMAKAVIKFRKDYQKKEKLDYDRAVLIMGSWFDRDVNRENKFDYLVDSEKFCEFSDEVLARVKALVR